MTSIHQVARLSSTDIQQGLVSVLILICYEEGSSMSFLMLHCCSRKDFPIHAQGKMVLSL